VKRFQKIDSVSFFTLNVGNRCTFVQSSIDHERLSAIQEIDVVRMDFFIRYTILIYPKVTDQYRADA
jgi:hypothetical protein